MFIFNWSPSFKKRNVPMVPQSSEGCACRLRHILLSTNHSRLVGHSVCVCGFLCVCVCGPRVCVWVWGFVLKRDSFHLFDFCRIINNSRQEILPGCGHSGQVPKQSSVALDTQMQKGPSLGKDEDIQRTPASLYVFAKVQRQRSLLARPTSADWSFMIQVKSKTEVSIVLILDLITSQENLRAGRREEQIMVNAVT